MIPKFYSYNKSTGHAFSCSFLEEPREVRKSAITQTQCDPGRRRYASIPSTVTNNAFCMEKGNVKTWRKETKRSALIGPTFPSSLFNFVSSRYFVLGHVAKNVRPFLAWKRAFYECVQLSCARSVIKPRCKGLGMIGNWTSVTSIWSNFLFKIILGVKISQKDMDGQSRNQILEGWTELQCTVEKR